MPECCDKSVEAEQARWQERFDYLADKYGVDGGGCDSGDPLDFAAAEVTQSLGKLGDENATLRASLGEARERVEGLEGYHRRILELQIRMAEGLNASAAIAFAVTFANEALCRPSSQAMRDEEKRVEARIIAGNTPCRFSKNNDEWCETHGSEDCKRCECACHNSTAAMPDGHICSEPQATTGKRPVHCSCACHDENEGICSECQRKEKPEPKWQGEAR